MYMCIAGLHVTGPVQIPGHTGPNSRHTCPDSRHTCPDSRPPRPGLVQKLKERDGGRGGEGKIGRERGTDGEGIYEGVGEREGERWREGEREGKGERRGKDMG